MAVLLSWANVSNSELHFVDGVLQDPLELCISLVDCGYAFTCDENQAMDFLLELREPFICLVIEILDIAKHASLKWVSCSVIDGITDAHLV